MSGESGYLDEAETIRDWFVAEWDSTVAIHIYENQKFTKPTAAHWARLTIRSQEGRPASIGGPSVRYRHDGNIILEVFAPEGTGDGRARELVDEGLAIIRGREEGGIIVWTARAIPIGVRDGWYKINGLGLYQRDEDFNVQS